ncbi:MAG TPA: membrane protein, partial [Rubrobacter sp.]|nr:membrane protein [Rubrobacter sp.]
LWFTVLVEERRRDLTLVDPFCTSWDRRTDLVWPDDLTAPRSAARYGTDATTGVEAARKAASRGPVYVLDHGRVDYDRFRRAGFDVDPVDEGSPLRELLPR